MNQAYTLITGASSGIGKALAKKCASSNMNLILVALPESGLEAYGQQLQIEYGVEVQTLAFNLADPESSIKIYEVSQKKNWQVNILINNVGLGNIGAFEECSYDAIQYQMMLNMNVMVSLTRLFLPHIKESRNGYILNVSSIAAMFPLPNKSIYAATKSFVYSFSRSLYFELENDNVMVSCLCPGPTVTNDLVQEATRNLGWRARYFTKSARQVAEVAIDNMLKRKFLIIPGWENKLMIWAGKIVPEGILLRYLGNMFRKSAPATNKAASMEHLPQKEVIKKSSNPSSIAERVRSSIN